MTANKQSRPEPLSVQFDSIPQQLQDKDQWVLWKYEWKEGNTGNGKWDKPPHTPQGQYASSTSHKTWSTLNEVKRVYERGIGLPADNKKHFDGIGFVPKIDSSSDLQLTLIDLDKCRNPDTGEIEPWAIEDLNQINSYSEVSPSGTGIRIIAKGRKLTGERKGRKKGPVEIYLEAHYLTITGHRMEEYPASLEERSNEIEKFYKKYFMKKEGEIPRAEYRQSDPERLTNDQIIQLATNAANGEKFRRLMDGNTSGYSSHSEADLALCCIIAFYTKTERQIERIWGRSGLSSRNKFRRDDYRSRTIEKALEIVKERHNNRFNDRRTDYINQINIIKKRIRCDAFPDTLPLNPAIVIKGPPRSGKSYGGIKQLIKKGSGNYFCNKHSIIQHVTKIFLQLGGRNAVWLEGKSRHGMCRKDKPNCEGCNFFPNQHAEDHISYFEVKRRAEELLREHPILNKDKIPSELCPYFTLRFAEKSASFCFAVVNFIEEVEPRALTILDEDPTLQHFYPPSAELCRYLKNKNEYKFDNTLGKALEQVNGIEEKFKNKDRPREEDLVLTQSLGTLRGVYETINATMSGEYTPSQCYERINEQLVTACKVNYDVRNKALKKFDENRVIDNGSSNIDPKGYLTSILFPYEKRPLHIISRGRSGYKSLFLIGDATNPILNMNWFYTNSSPERQVLIIGNTLAELFADALGTDAVVIEISKFKYSQNFAVIPVDNGENTQSGEVKNQRCNIKKCIKAIAGTTDSKSRFPLLVLTGSRDSQDALNKSLGGIVHKSLEEAEVGQKWNHLSGSVNAFYQNSTISRGLDLDQYSLLFVHDADFLQPFWSAAIEAGDDRAEAIRDSIVMDETTNSALRISPVVGGNEHRPKIIVMPEIDLWKLRYLDSQIIKRNKEGPRPDIDDIVTLIKEYNLPGTVYLDDSGSISVNDELKEEGDWFTAVKEGKLIEHVKSVLNEISIRDKYSQEELNATVAQIRKIMKEAGRGTWLSRKDLKERGLRCKNALIGPALQVLYYRKEIVHGTINRHSCWTLNSHKKND